MSERRRAVIVLLAMVLAIAAVASPAYAAPVNDNFAAASVLTGATGSVEGTNYQATSEPGEPGHPNWTVWYLWSPPYTGWATFTVTCRSGLDFNPIVAVYQGTDLVSLIPVVSNFDKSPTAVSFPATKGVTYRIVVDGFWFGWEYTLSWEGAHPHAVPIPASSNWSLGLLAVLCLGLVPRIRRRHAAV